MIGSSKSLSGFDPRTIPGCSLWLDGADTTTLTLSASNVTAWTDKSPLATPFTLSNGSGGSTIRTTYAGLPVVQVSNSCFFNASYSYPLATRSIFFVMAETVHSDWRGLLSFANTAGQSDYNTQNGYTITSTNTVGSNVQFSQNAGNGGFVFNYNASNGVKNVPFQLYEDVTSNTAVTLFITGSNVYSSNTSVTPLTSTGLTVGGRGGIPNTGALVIAEVLLYSNVLTTSQRQQVEGYLAHKWGVSGYSPTTPLSIPGCQLWLDAADASTVTGTTSVTAWRDKSTNGYSANSFVNSVAYPSLVSNVQNGNSVIQYSAGNGSSIANFVLAQTMSIFMVYYPINQSTDGPFLEHGPDTNSTSGLYFHAQNGNNFSINSGSGQVAVNFGTTAVSNTWQMIEGINPDPANGNTMAYYVNGTTMASGGIQSGTTTLTKTLYINGRGGANNVSYNTYLAELIIFNIAVTTSQRQTIEGYLAKKWGITSMYLVLPSIHPFSSIRPHLRAFHPTDIDGCQLWLDAADSTTITFSSGSNVNQWSDKSGNGRNATVYNGTPTYTVSSGMTFNGSSSLQITYPASPAVETLFMIIKFNSVSGQSSIFAGTAVGQREYLLYSPYSPGTMYLGRYGSAPSGSINGGTVTTGTTYMLNYVFNGTGNTISFFQSGTVTSSGTPQFTYGAGGTITLIGSYGGGGFLQGQIYEILVYNTALTTSERQQVEGYLAHKWGLTLYLPVISPLSIPGCQLWLDGADTSSFTLSGSNVTQWSDKSGNGNNATPYSTSPQRVGNGVLFSGSNALKCGKFLTSTSYSVFIVNNFASGFSNNISLGCWKVQYGSSVIFQDGSIRAGVNNSSSYNVDASNSTASYTTNRIYGLTLSSSSTPGSAFTFNGSIDGSNVSLSGTSASGNATTCAEEVTIGGLMEDGIPKYQLNGYVYEIITYNNALTTTQRQQIEGYLARKWGITISATLPSLHPFKSIPPATSAHFSPTSISGCQLWLDADDALNFTGSTWNDKSGTNNHAVNGTPGTSSMPTVTTWSNGRRAARFVKESKNSIKTTNSIPLYVTYFIVTRVQDVIGATGFALLMVNNYDGQRQLRTNSTSFPVSVFYFTQTGGTNMVLGSFSQGQEFLFSGTVTSGSAIGYSNGVQIGTSGVNPNTIPSRHYFGSGDGDAAYVSADFGEIVIYDSVLTTSQRQQVEGYLAHKWGLTSSLPSKHPYRPLPPIFPPNLFIPTPSMYSAFFNNSSLTIPANAALTLGTNNHTIEFWMYQLTRTGSGYDTPFIYGNTSYFGTNTYYFCVAEYLGFVVGNGAGDWAININGGTITPLNVWNHYAIVRNGTTFTLYINGISRGSQTSSVNITAQGDVFRIGTFNSGGWLPINGYITNFRLVNGTAVYTSNFTPPTSPLTAIPNTQILLQGLVDNSPNAFTITNNGGVTLSTTVTPF